MQEGISGIEVALTKRYDMLTKMLDTAKGYMAHESELFEKVIELRRGMSVSEMNDAQQQMDTLSGKLFAVAEEFDYLDGDYYRQDDDQALEKMQSLLDPVINKLIPLLDKISSQDDYLRAKEYYLDLGSRLARPIIPEYALLQKALNDRSFAESDRILQKAIDYCIARELSRYDTREERQILIKRYDDSELDTFPDALKPYLQMVERLKQSEEEYAKELKKLDRMMEVHYANYIAIREKEDFDAIETLYNENLAKMKEEIKIKLKIDL